MDLSSSEEISSPESSSSPAKLFSKAPQLIDPAANEPIKIPVLARNLAPTQQNPSSTSYKTNTEQPQPNLETTSPEPHVEAISRTVAEDIVRLFSQSRVPTNILDIPLVVQPLTAIPPQTETPPEPNQPDSTQQLTIFIPHKPQPQTKPRTTCSAPSSPNKDLEVGNLVPEHRRSTRDDIQVIKRTHQEGESSQVGVKIPLRTSDADEFNYLPDDVREENRRSFEEMERRKVQDK